MNIILPQDFIDDLKVTIDLKELAEEYTTLKKVGMHVFSGICPNPEHIDKNPSFTVFQKGYKNGNKINKYDTWCCYGCHHGNKIINSEEKNYGSDCIAFIQWINKCSFYEAVKFLCNKYNICMPENKNGLLIAKNRQLAIKYYMNLKGESLDYLKSRGLSFDDCRKHLLGTTLDNKKIVFPLFDRMKNVIGFTKRWIHMTDDKEDKYRNSPNSSIFNKSSYFYNIENIDLDFKEIRITEGPMDVILAEKYGAKNIVSTLGTSFTEYHIKIIKNYGMIPVFIFDGDEAGLKAIKKSISLCGENNIYCKLLLIPNNMDLAEFSLEQKDNIENYIINNSKTYGNYLIESEVNNYVSKINELKLQSYPKLLSILEKVPHENEKKILKDYIQNIININL